MFFVLIRMIIVCLFFDAQHLILVDFILANLFSLLVIESSHGSYEGRHWVEILPTGLPDLSKPSRDLLELRKTEFFRINNKQKNV